VQRSAAEAAGRRLPEDDEAFTTVEGTLRADAAPGDSGVSLALYVEEIGPSKSSGGVALTAVGAIAPSLADTWRVGRRVRMPATLHRPSRYLDPGVPDHERELARRGIALVGTVKSGALVELVARGTAVDEALGAVRAFARRAIAQAVGRWSRESAAIVAAIVIGDRAGLDPQVQQRLQEAGTYHVIAISGGNIAILAGLLIGMFRLGGWLGRSAMIAAIAALLAYARLVGGGASVDRATLMAVAAFGARAWDHRTSPLNALAVVAAVLVAADPLSIADPAFVLTCGATLAILIVMNAKNPWLNASSQRLVRPAVALLVASVAAETMLFPVAAVMFSRVTFAGLALNFLAIPLMGVAQVAGMVLVPVALVSTHAAAAVGWLAHVGAAGLVWSANLVRFAPALSWRVAPPPWLIVIAYYVALGGWWALRGNRIARRAAAVAAALAGAWILLDPRTIVAARGDGRLHLTFIDVGQGDAIFIAFPRGSTMLVDAGGLSTSSSFDIGDRVVAPVLRAAGVRRLDVVALSHGDPDHAGGMPAVIAEFHAGEVWEGIPVPRAATLQAIHERAQRTGTRLVNVYTGERRTIDGVDVDIRHPPPADWERQKVRNDDSLVIELRWQNVSVLLTGDIGRVPERDLARTLPPAAVRIVKIPHHGSLTSSSPELVNAIRAQVAVVSAGRNNHFGHPVPEVLDRYRASGAEIFRTDRDGAVMLDTDGASVDVRTFAGRKVAHEMQPRRHEDAKD